MDREALSRSRYALDNKILHALFHLDPIGADETPRRKRIERLHHARKRLSLRIAAMDLVR